MTIGRLEKWTHDQESEIKYFKRLLRRSPKNYSLLNFLANALYKKAEYEEAIYCWKRLLRKQAVKDIHRILSKIALAYESLGEIEFAFYYYGEALKEAPKTPSSLIGKYGQMAYLLEDYDDALAAFKEMVEIDPDNDVAWHNLGLTYYNKGLKAEAIDCLEIAVSLNEKASDSLYVLATIYAEEYQSDNALEALEHALTIDPSLREQASKEESFSTLTNLALFQYLIL
ncbi:MAG: tetratricopeptide repeat protein [Candidatus Heimdallarchaeota archaeon]|nr:tetratricopeptide repeat protein [Candidatus Heimdallarchaeota archaeon]